MDYRKYLVQFSVNGKQYFSILSYYVTTII